MSHPVVTLHKREQVSRIIEVLRLYPHEGFPVVDCTDQQEVSNCFLIFVPLANRHKIIRYLIGSYREFWITARINTQVSINRAAKE